MKLKQWLLNIALLCFVTGPLPAEDAFQIITVPAGETLWSISNRYLKDPKKWTEIVRYNPTASADPTVPMAGTKIKIPVSLIKEEFQRAEVIKTVAEVQYQQKNKADWKKASLNMLLSYDDSIRTMVGAQAQVRFPTKEVVQINENSYVVIRPEKFQQEVKLMSGDIRASRAKVITPNGTVVKPQGSKSDFQTKIRPDQTEVVFVYKGKVDVTAQGKTVTVPEGYGTQVPKSAPPSEPIPLPTFKDFNPAEMTRNIADATLPPPSTVKVAPVTIKPFKPDEKPATPPRTKALVANSTLVSYQLQLAKEPSFQTILLTLTESIGTEFDVKKQNIPDGTYYVRVAFLDSLGGMGSYSQPSIVVKDGQAPIFKRLWPEEGQSFKPGENYCDVNGIVEGATLISINGEVVFISPTGQFSKIVTLKPGENTVRISARDAQNNETNIRRKVFYKN